MIIVEGPDGSGKTTLINRLGYKRRHLRALRAGRGADGDRKQGWGGSDEASIAYTRQLLRAQWDEQYQYPSLPPIAFDRFHLSELVYGPLLRGASGITKEEALLLNRVITGFGIPVILCIPPLKVTIDNVMRQGRERPAYQTESFLRTAYERFALFAAYNNVQIYDFTQDPTPFQKLPLSKCPPGVIGSPSARYFIVAETSTLPCGLPWLSMRKDGSGYLNRALWAAGFEENQLAFTIAHRDLRRTYDSRFLGADVIAVGKKAAKACLTCKLAAIEIPHPQYWSRFHADKHEDYVNILRDIRLGRR